MGTWGHGIRQNDAACDVIGAFEDQLKQRRTIAEATKTLQEQFTDYISDDDDGPLFWIALADMQWTYGDLAPEVLQKVVDDFQAERGHDLWKEASEKDYRQRCQKLAAFIQKLQTPNPKPKKPPKVVIRKPIYQAGDCLSVRLSNGQYGAAFVLAADHSEPEYGKNLLGIIDFMSPDPPPADIFAQRRWLVLTHHAWNKNVCIFWYLPVGHRAAKSRIQVVGQQALRADDPRESLTYAGWADLCADVIRQRTWDADHPAEAT